MIRENVLTYKKIEQKLSQVSNKISKSDDLIHAFLSNVSHEIRTPLNSILGFSELLKQPDISNDEKEEFFGYIDHKCNYLLNYIDNIIDLSKVESDELMIKKENFKIYDLLLGLKKQFDLKLQQYQKENIEIILKIPEDVKDLYMYSDIRRVKKVLENLLSNSIKFTKEGTITFGFKMKNENIVEFFIEDTGIGLKKEDFDEIFIKFKVVNEAFSKKIGGAGLGLTISKHIVKKLGGELWLESKEGVGSTFFFTIKLNDKGNTNNVFDVNWNDKVILVADDVEMNYLFIEAALRKTNVNLMWAKNGKEAFSMFNYNYQKDEDIDLIIMDIQMPYLNGYEATRRIKQVSGDVPIISHTAYDFEEEKEKSIKAGCDDYISKPVTSKMLISKLNQYIYAY